MTCVYVFCIALFLHLLTRRFAFSLVEDYLLQTQVLLRAGRPADGCSTPFKTQIHRWLKHSRELCAAHDYGSLGLIASATPGWHNNWVTWLAHMSQRNPIYWVWGTVVALVTLPWVVWRRNWGITFLDMTAFYVILTVSMAMPFLIYYQPVR